MGTVTLRLDSRELENPDLDLRYAIPDLLVERSGGSIRDGGYDYETDYVIAIDLDVDDVHDALALIERTFRDEIILGNHLAGRVTVTPQP